MAVISLNSNAASRTVQRSLSTITDNLRRASERLSSGLRINRASDDAAGLAVSSSLQASSRIYSQAIRNGNDAISALNVADGSLGEMSAVLTRMKELSQQAANGTLSSTQRRSLDREAQQLVAEFSRLQSTTTFNGIQLVANNASTVGIQLGVGHRATLNINLGIYGTSSSSSSSESYGGMAPGPRVHNGSIADFGVGDFDGDGFDDLVVVDTAQALVYTVMSDGESFQVGSYAGYSGGAVAGLVVGDFDHDGMDDFIVAQTNGTVDVFQGVGGGNINQVNTLYTGLSFGSAKGIAADLDGSGGDDFVLAAGSDVVTLIGDGFGGFTTNTATATGAITSLAVGNFTGDGYLDVLAARGSSIELFTGDGYSLFNRTVTGITGTFIAADGDLDSDGFDDFVASTGTSFNFVKGFGDGSFIVADSHAVSSGSEIEISDFNGDGVKDVQILTFGYSNLWNYSGNENGTFSFQEGFGSVDIGTLLHLRVGDFNNDGYTDAFATDNLSIANFFSIVDSSSTSTSTVALDDFSLVSAASARAAMGIIDAAMDRITATRGSIGSSMSRIGVALNTLQASRENSDAAASRIKDADIGSESANYVRLTLLQQAGAALLAQANQMPSLALQLLRP